MFKKNFKTIFVISGVLASVWKVFIKFHWHGQNTTQATKQTSDVATYVSILILLAIACVFTVAGGLSAVIWTDFVQTILMIIGAFILCAKGKFLYCK